MPDITSEISAAVDKAMTATTDSSSATPSPKTSTSAPADKSLTSPPADASGPEAQQPPSSSTVPPTRQASDAAATPVDDKKTGRGEPPQSEWPTILGNARQTGRNDALAEYGIPKNADPAIVRSHVAGLNTDPVAYHRDLGEMLKRHGYIKDDGSAASSAVEDAGVDFVPDIQTEDGRQWFSAGSTRKLIDSVVNSLRREFTGQVQPLQDAHAQATEAGMRHDAKVRMATVFNNAKASWPGFTELLPEMASSMRENKTLSLADAYLALYPAWRTRKDATLSADARQKVIDDMKNAPGDTGTVKPSATRQSSRQKGRGGSFDDMLNQAVNVGLDAVRPGT